LAAHGQYFALKIVILSAIGLDVPGLLRQNVAMKKIFASYFCIALIFGLWLLTSLAFAQTAPRPAVKPAVAARPAIVNTAGRGVVSDALNKDKAGEKPAARPKPVRDPALYVGEAIIAAPGDNEKRIAIANALGQVMVKLTGNPGAMSNIVVRRSMASANSLIASTSNRQITDSASGLPTFKTALVVSFDPNAIDALIAAAGMKYWTGARPKPILWLAIDDGRGPRLVSSQQLDVVKPLATRGLERGLRFLLPAGNASEQAVVNSVWTLNAAAMEPYTARYQNNTQVLGKVYRSVSGWSAQWVMTQNGAEVARWVDTKADPRQVIASGANGAADALAKRDAVYFASGAAGKYRVDISGIYDGNGYIRVMTYLQQMAVIKRVQVLQASPEGMRVELDMSTGINGFNSLIKSDGVLKPAQVVSEDTAEAEADSDKKPEPGSEDKPVPPPVKSVPRYILQ
jgi:uncharacterized protein